MNIWQLPQHLMGLLLIRLFKAEKQAHNDAQFGVITWYRYKRDGRLSRFVSGGAFGKIVLLPDTSCSEDTIRHEHGHGKQSEILGWLYLPLVGVYSAVFCNLWDRWFHKGWCAYDRHYWYYKTRLTERDADKRGKVNRDMALCQMHRPANARYPAVTAA